MSLCDWHYSHLTSVYKQLNLSKYPTPVRALVVNTSELETRTYFDCWICHCVERYLFDNPTKNLYYTFSAKSQNSRECRIAVNTAAPAVEYPEDFFDEGNTFVRTSLPRLAAMPITCGIYLDYDKSLGQASRWVGECDEGHEECRMHRKKMEVSAGGLNWVPSRLVEIDREGRTWKVVSTTHDLTARIGCYASLSHCWGPPDALPKLSRANMFVTEQPFSALPHRFQDVLMMVTNLQCRYIWIDCLCIVQDQGDDDWAIESLTMEKVYANSYINIAISTSELDLDNPFRSGENLRPGKGNHEITLSIDGTEFATGYCDIRKRNFIQGQMKDSPLLDRSWVVQERILSPRNLYLGNEMLLFECLRPGIKLEEFPNFGELNLARCRRTPIYDIAPTSSEEDVYGIWNMIFREYSRTQLSFQSDRLVALGGVARLFGRFTRDEYIAGMWKRWLPWHLYWVVDTNWQPKIEERARKKETVEDFPRFMYEQAERVPDRRAMCKNPAPSWSWASVPHVSIDSKSFEHTPLSYGGLVRLLNYSLQDGGNPFGVVGSGYIDLACFTLPIIMVFDTLYYQRDLRASRMFFTSETASTVGSEDETLSLLKHVLVDAKHDKETECTDETAYLHQLRQRGRICAMDVQQDDATFRGMFIPIRTTEMDQTRGLILRQVNNNNVYRRVAAIEFESRLFLDVLKMIVGRDGEKVPDEILALLDEYTDQRDTDLGCFEFEDPSDFFPGVELLDGIPLIGEWTTIRII